MKLSILILAAAASTSKCGGASDLPYLGCSAQGVRLAYVPNEGQAYQCTADSRAYGNCGGCEVATETELVIVALPTGYEPAPSAIEAAGLCWEAATWRQPEAWSVVRSCVWVGPWTTPDQTPNDSLDPA